MVAVWVTLSTAPSCSPCHKIAAVSNTTSQDRILRVFQAHSQNQARCLLAFESESVQGRSTSVVMMVFMFLLSVSKILDSYMPQKLELQVSVLKPHKFFGRYFPLGKTDRNGIRLGPWIGLGSSLTTCVSCRHTTANAPAYGTEFALNAHL
ncbi:hypothetical protein BGZ60DRAFT_410177, partial [Tricladium varicosporioides]